MAKHLTAVGNSYAYVIEKPILRMLGIRRKTLLRLSIDGRRIILEPVPDSGEPIMIKPRRRERTLEQCIEDARATLDRLCSYQVGSYFWHLGEGLDVQGYRSELGACHRGPRVMSPMLDRIMTRLEVCLEILEADRSWSEAMSAALEACPMPPGSQPTGQPSDDWQTRMRASIETAL